MVSFFMHVCRVPTVNVGFLTSGKQFTPPRVVDMEGGDAYKSNAKRLADFHAKTQAAAEKATKDGLAPVAQAISPLTEYAWLCYCAFA